MSDRVIDEYDILYLQTGNPLYAWQALSVCRRDEPLPGWVFDYLLGCAVGRPNAEATSVDRLPALHNGDGILVLASKCRAVRDAIGGIAKRDAERKAYRRRPDNRKINEECERLDAEYVQSMGDATSQAAGLVARAVGLRKGANFNAFADKLNREDRAAKALYLDNHRGQRWAWTKIQADMAKLGETSGSSRQQIYKDAKEARRLWDMQRQAADKPKQG